MPANPYLELIRSNRNYRRLWMGDMASLLGDWFNMIAVYTLVRELTGSPLALGLVFITRMLPFALASPVGGLLVDRFNRRRLMIAADLTRALIVLGLLLIHDAADLPLLYLLMALQMVVSAVFIPAHSSSIPNITSKKELVTANALSSATWSTLLALGAAAGGFATDLLGTQAIFILDSLSYCVSAFFLYRTVIPQRTDPAAVGNYLRVAARQILDGWRYVRRNPPVGRIALAKTAWGLGGGGLVYMLALLGEEVRPEAPAVGIGLLYAARGLGTGIGPIAARAFIPDPRHWPAMLGLGIAASGAFYLVIGSAAWTLAILPLVLLAHAPSGANWVFSTVMLQQRAPDNLRGRIFSTEWLLLTIADTLAILTASFLLQTGRLELRSGILLFASIQVICGGIWLATVVPAERRERESNKLAG